MSAERPRVSVIVPTYDKAPYLDLSLASWCHQRASDYELVLVDDGSTDDTPAVVERYAARLPIRYSRTENGGRAAARNCALAQARGEVLVFCDDDRIVHPDFVQAHVDALDRADGDLVVLGWQYGFLGEVRPDEPLPVPVAVRLARARPELEAALTRRESFRTAVAADLADGLGILDLLQAREPWFEDHVMPVIDHFGEDITGCELAWMFGTTGNMSITRELLDRVGGFDEEFRGWGLEDTELHYRLVKAGARTRICREAINYHQNHPRDHKRLMASWMANSQILFEKHESIEVALYMRMTLAVGMSVVEAHQIISDARAIRDSALLRAYQRLLFARVHQLIDAACATSVEG